MLSAQILYGWKEGWMEPLPTWRGSSRTRGCREVNGVFSYSCFGKQMLLKCREEAGI